MARGRKESIYDDETLENVKRYYRIDNHDELLKYIKKIVVSENMRVKSCHIPKKHDIKIDRQRHIDCPHWRHSVASVRFSTIYGAVLGFIAGMKMAKTVGGQ